MRAIGLSGPETGIPAPSWRKSSRSAHNGACVEVAPVPGHQIAVRDSKNPAGASVVFSAQSWASFVAGLKEGASLS